MAAASADKTKLGATNTGKDKHYELRYFNLRGRGEPLRLMFHYLKVNFVDTGIEFKDWPTEKAKQPLGQLPVLIEAQGSLPPIQIPQSMTIARHLARTFNLYGSTEQEHTTADMVSDTVTDMALAFTKARGFPGSWLADQKAIDEFYAKSGPFEMFVKHFENFITKNPSQSGFTVAAAPVYSDFQVYEAFDTYHFKVKPKSLDASPKLQAFMEKMRNLDGVKQYLPKQRASVFTEK